MLPNCIRLVNASDNIDEVSKLKKRLYVCAYGATPPAPAGYLNSDSEEDHDEAENQRSWGPTGPLPVPYRRALDLRQELRELISERNQLRQQPREVDRLRKELKTSQVNEAIARSRQLLAEVCRARAEAEQEEAWAATRAVEQSMVKKISEIEASSKDAQLAAEIALSKAGRREFEAAALMKRTEKRVLSLESHKAMIAQELLLTVQIAQSELAIEEMAHTSAECARAELAEALALAEHDRSLADAAAQGIKAKLKSMDAECKQAKGKVERLQGQLVVAHVEAARATEAAQKEAKTVQTLQGKLELQQATAQAELRHVLDLKANMAKRARDATKRASFAHEMEKQLQKTRKDLREARKELNSMMAQLHEKGVSIGDLSASDLSGDEKEEDSSTDDERAEAQEALRRIRTMPQWHSVRGVGAGKGATKMEWGTRVIVYALLAMMVPASAVGAAIVAIVKRTAPWLQPSAPTCETVRRCRFELRFVEEALAGRRIAAAYRIRSIGFDETTKLGNASLTSNMQIEPTPGAKLQDVILRAAYCPFGATSELVVESIDTKCLSRLREFLRRWRSQFETMFPGAQWTGPDAARCSLHRLGGGGALISDTCNAARKSKQLLAKLVAKQVEESIGAETWSSMSQEDRDRAVCTHKVDCWQHLRNIFLAEMSAAQVFLKCALETARFSLQHVDSPCHLCLPI